jgi:hypothetical protein
MVLGFELRILSLSGRFSATQAMTLNLFTLVILERGSHFFPKLTLTPIFLFYTSVVLGMTGVCPHAQIFSVEMDLANFFLPGVVWNHDLPDLRMLGLPK